MPRFRTAFYTVTALLAPLVAADSQTVASASAEAKARAIAASFSKSKHITKEKRGVRKEKYLDVRSTPALRADPASYSGIYKVPGMGLSLELRVAANGDVEGKGYEPVDQDASVMRSFTLKDARIQGALLTATQVYANGATDRFEGVFMDRTSFNSPNDKGTTEFGLGVMGRTVRVAGVTINRFFYQLDR